MWCSRFVFVLAALLLGSPPLAAAPATAAATATPAATTTPSATVAGAPDIHALELDNGLCIYVLERRTSPTFMAYYQFGVGGAADPKGRSGIAHLLEHMMFKGTRNLGTLDAGREATLMRQISGLWHQLDAELDRAGDPFAIPDSSRIRALQEEIARLSDAQKQLILKNEYDELLTRAGGVGLNASTSNDRTNYYVELPANRLELWFQMESDRLLHPVFREFWSERDVVRAERRQNLENQAEGLVRQALLRSLFEAHPYGTPVIGWPRDIERLKQEDAESYFHTYYSPSNCVMVLVGDVDTKTVERLARKYLGGWKRQSIPSLEITSEPAARGERRRVVEFDAEPSLALGWVTVPEGDLDGCALDILATVLGGLRSSRLDRALVQEQGLASRASCSHPTLKWGGYFQVTAYPKGEHTLAELETAIEQQILRMQTDGITADELERAKVQNEVGRVASLKSNSGQALTIGNAVGIAGTPAYAQVYDARLDAVTAGQVQAVCKKYLAPDRRCVVEVHKVAGLGAAQEQAEAAHHRGGSAGERGTRHSRGFAAGMNAIREAPPLQLDIPTVGKDVTRVVLPSGVTVFLKEDHTAPSVEMRFTWLGGSNSTPVEQLAPFAVASRLLSEGGTETLDPIALAEKKEQLGMSFGIGIYGTTSAASFWSLHRNFGESFALAMDILMRPRLDAHRLEVLKGQFIDGQRRRFDAPQRGLAQLRTQVLYADHPRLGYQATRAEVEAVTPADVRRIWERYLGRDNLYVTAVGDFDAAGMLTLLDHTFSTWRTAPDKQRQFIVRDPSMHPGLFLVEKEISAPVISISHQMRLDRTAPLADHAALEILNDILGGNGFTSRLMERLRSDEGLTYGIYSNLSHQGRPGMPGEVAISYSTKKQSVARSIDSALEEFRKMASAPVSPAEVEEQIDSWRNRFVFQFTDDFDIVTSLMGQELDDRPYGYDQQMLAAVQKVTPADVERVAKQYLQPADLTVCVFGSLTDEDRAALSKEFALRVLSKEEVFRGGYDRPAKAGAGSRGAWPTAPSPGATPQ